MKTKATLYIVSDEPDINGNTLKGNPIDICKRDLIGKTYKFGTIVDIIEEDNNVLAIMTDTPEEYVANEVFLNASFIAEVDDTGAFDVLSVSLDDDHSDYINISSRHSDFGAIPFTFIKEEK